MTYKVHVFIFTCLLILGCKSFAGADCNWFCDPNRDGGSPDESDPDGSHCRKDCVKSYSGDNYCWDANKKVNGQCPPQPTSIAGSANVSLPGDPSDPVLGSGKPSNAEGCTDAEVQANKCTAKPGSPADVAAKAQATKDKSEADAEAAQLQAARAACQSDLNQMVKSCSSAATSAQYSCMNQGATQAAMTKAATALGSAAGAQSAASIKDSCSKAAKFFTAANAAAVAFKQICQNSMITCTNSCVGSRPSSCTSGTDDLVADANSNLRSSHSTCSGYSSVVQGAQSDIQNIAVTLTQAQQCDLLTSASVPTPDFCKSNPSLSGCEAFKPTDCNSPEMANNTVCICSKNPNSTACSVAKAQDPQINNTVTANRIGSKGSEALKSGADNNGIPSQPGYNPVSTGYSASGIDGQQGPSARLSKGGGDATVQRKVKGAASSAIEPMQVTDGFYGSAGSSEKQTIGGGPAPEFGKDKKRKPASANDSDDASVDLSRFLPSGSYRPPGMAGSSSGRSIEIAGPHTDIWKTVQKRYETLVITNSLMP